MNKVKIRFIDAKSISTATTEMDYAFIIADYVWWVDHEAEILDWFKQSEIEYSLQGMVLYLTNNDDFLMFRLRWDG